MGIPIVTEFLQVFLKNPILAWFTITFVLLADTTSGANIIGFVITSVFNFIGLNVEVKSLFVLIIVAFTPLFRYAIEHSGN